MSGNIHAKAALNDGNTLHEQQIEAQLAIAHELRTANLIAAMQPIILPDGEAIGLTVKKLSEMQQEILERLKP